VSDAIRLVLQRYIAEGDVARRRYALTSTVPALRDREIATVARYQRVLREFIAEWMGESGEPASLRAEIMAAAVVAAHNHVLRRWLRGESNDPVTELDAALRQVISLFAEFGAEPAIRGQVPREQTPGEQTPRGDTPRGQAPRGQAPDAPAGDGTAILAFRTSQDLQTLVSSLRQIIEIDG
jgi:hypothetical protein